MAVFRKLLGRWGFVKLDRYGLVRTPDDRILSTRPAALDDGGGGRIVGWRDDDLAMAELTPWGAERSAHAPAQPHVQIPATKALAPPTGLVTPVAVAPEPAVEEDDWEWTIALARARAAAEEPQAPPAQAQPVQSAPIVSTPTPPADSAPLPRKPATVIPVPQLPSILDAGRAARFGPVVRTTVTAVAPAPPAPPNRLALGTAPIDSDTEQIPTMMSDDTEQSFAIGDRTKPGIGMPLAARAVALPSTRGRPERRG